MANFDWLTEDEGEWAAEGDEGKRSKKRPSWQFPLLILVALGLTLGGLYSFVSRRAESTEETIKADVRRTHQLMMEAADNGDVELFTTFLSGADVSWLELQGEMVNQKHFDEIPWLGFQLNEQPYRLDKITLSPALDEATVTYTRWYENSDLAGGPFALQHVVVYRRGEDRWLLAPPTAEFWGEEATIVKGKLTIVYPERDEGQISRLADDLAASLPEVCNELDFSECPTGWQIRLELSADLRAELFPTPMVGSFDDLSLQLPTLSLVGIPVDRSGYEAVLESYQGRLRSDVIASLNHYLATQPGLVPPVLETRNIGGEFARSKAVVPGPEIILSCMVGGVGRIESNIFRYSLATGDWNVDFTQSYEGADSGIVIALPGGNGYVIQEYLRDELLTARLLLHQNDETILIGEQTVNFDNALMAPYFLRQSDPTGRYLVIGSLSELDNNWFLLDREQCSEADGCERQPIMNVPIWSPDGAQMLIAEHLIRGRAPRYQTLFRADAAAQNLVELGEGGSPFWLNETTYGYRREDNEGQGELVVANSVDDNAVVWVTAADLIPLAPADRNWLEFNIWNVWVNPADPDMALLMTTPTGVQNSGPYDFFLVKGDPLSGRKPQIKWLFSDEFPASSDPRPFSPDGRFLLVGFRGVVDYFEDLETGELVSVDPSLGDIVDWSPDGFYYVQWRDDAVTLTSPSTGLQARIKYNFSACLDLEWAED
ncbi:MAG: hypothetical protein WAM60_10475 [Candidatus Promineifilaceae bacterium]